MVHIPATEGTPRDKAGKEKAAAPRTTAKSTPDDTLLEGTPLSDAVQDLQQERARGRGKPENKRRKKKPKTRANSKSEEESDPWFWGFFEGLGGDNGDGDWGTHSECRRVLLAPSSSSAATCHLVYQGLSQCQGHISDCCTTIS
ncbi:hypothetical protein FALBO_14801 [Fusarium albosuccineum]|uniref:Uncharacterized protein n=1 Tax=Fusarium albosuccineum TaxID=1237068 RepID=A0A8H4P5X0_9HYPO|nr:hypothetical protein FALBO_14801 [Fusarium albosuccineum]